MVVIYQCVHQPTCIQTTITERDGTLCLFKDLNIRWPGSVHCHSQLYEQAQSGDILSTTHSKTIRYGVSVPPYLIGDAAYLLKTWLMKPFPDRGLLDDRKRYNYHMSQARMVVENAFGRLKGRWRCLLKRNDMSLERVPTVIAACCSVLPRKKIRDMGIWDRVSVHASMVV